MHMSEAEVAEVRSKLQGLIGQRAWRVALGVGSNLTLEFGVVSERAKPHGEWHLWLQSCAWRLETLKQVVAGSDDPRESLQAAVKILEGLRLNGIELTVPAPDVTFEFENGTLLKLFPFNFSGDFDDWSLYTPDGSVLIFGGANSWRYVPA